MADVVVTRDGDSGMGAGIILGILVAIIAVAFAVWSFGFNGAGDQGTTINVAPPQVNVQNPAQPSNPAPAAS